VKFALFYEQNQKEKWKEIPGFEEGNFAKKDRNEKFYYSKVEALVRLSINHIYYYMFIFP
jgi:hypothetical protein